MSVCTLCPRRCAVDRTKSTGCCRMGADAVLARAALHFWEEPCISGAGGSGTIFFSGCSLGCVFCQNRVISADGFGERVTAARLREIMRALVEQGADNINLVTPTHFADAVLAALRGFSPGVPVVWNSGGYDSVATLRRLEGLVDIYMPDFKYASRTPAAQFSGAPDYPERAVEALREMYRQTGKYRTDAHGMLYRGLLVRHLVLPGEIENTLDVIDTFSSMFRPGEALFSLLGQYTPPPSPLPFPELNRPLTQAEYDRAVDYLYLAGIEDGFVQELSAASETYTPAFDLTGVHNA